MPFTQTQRPLYEVKANLFKGLAHPFRIRILELLSDAPERSVADLQSAGAWAGQALGAVTLGVLAAALVRPSSGARDAAPDAPAGTTTGAPDPR